MTTNTKLILVGPVGAGKTTAVRTMVDSDMVCTDERATDMTRQWKESTTVALDYGAVRPWPGHKVHLYGLPGQERFRFMWEILILGGDAVVVLVDNSRPAPLHDLRFYVEHFRPFAERERMTVAITKRDLAPSGPGVEEYRDALARLSAGERVPVLEVDVRCQRQMAALVRHTVERLEPLENAF